MDLQLTGRVAVITGASKGIGLEIVRAFTAEGARVIAASRTLTEELAAIDGDVIHVAVDLMDAHAPAEVIARAVELHGGLDVLVNNAGGPPPGVAVPHGGFLTRTDADWHAVLEFNLLTAVRASRAALPILVERGGTIVNIASTAARQPATMNLDYAAAKAAMLALTKALSEEFAPQGVRVNAVSPGATITPWWTDEGGAADVFASSAGVDRETALASLAPEMMQLSIGRLARPSEIADAVAFVASPRCASLTGADIQVDSGGLKTV
ncbi:MAG: SDR family oxidoreductase [Solirubrobacteraceae bacterium]|nr:SDR family oxidoreductase [Solirubrobacteraceae bacterium]